LRKIAGHPGNREKFISNKKISQCKCFYAKSTVYLLICLCERTKCGWEFERYAVYLKKKAFINMKFCRKGQNAKRTLYKAGRWKGAWIKTNRFVTDGRTFLIALFDLCAIKAS
jgi:hypothetical protein